MNQAKVLLNNGVRMPVIGLGTYRLYNQHRISEVLAPSPESEVLVGGA
jgi:diketogulonate reductase-like aldo/keto reductase